MSNPFIYGKEVSGRDFCNRESEIASLLEDIRSGQNVIIYSPRRYGKTSLIKKVIKYAEDENIAGIYVDLYGILTEEDFIKKYATAISQSLKGSIEKVLENIKKLFKSIRPKISINSQGDPEVGVELIQNIDLMVEDVSEAIKRFSMGKKQKIVVVFDEFQQIEVLKNDKLERNLRSIIQTHGREITYIFMGSKNHMLQKIFSNPNKPFYKIGRHFPMGKIKAEELVSFILTKFKDSGKIITRENAKKIVSVAECHPYYVQHLCSSVWKLTQDQVTEKIIENALNLTIGEEVSAFNNLWDGLTLNQKKTIYMLASVEQHVKIFSRENLSRFSLTAEIVQKALKSLIEKDLIVGNNGAYILSDVFFKLWLRMELKK